MRKPVVVGVLFLTLLLLLTLVRRLAQPAIGENPAIAAESPAVAAQTAVPSPPPAAAPLLLPPPPARPVLSAAKPVLSSATAMDGHASNKAPARSRETLKRTVRQNPVAVQQQDDARQPSPAASPYRALLGQPSSRIRRVVDHGAHGIGTPQWIEPLSGPKTRVPVRDFAAEKDKEPQSPVRPLAVPVNSHAGTVINSAQ